MRYSRKDPLFKEVKRILLNQVELDTDGRFVATDEARIQLWGPAEGGQKIRTLGVAHQDYVYEVDDDINPSEAIEEAKRAVNNIGRGINIKARKNVVAVFVRSYVFYPVVLIFFENDDKELQLSLFTARTFTAYAATWWVRKKFDKAMDGIVERVGNKEGKKTKVKDKSDSESDDNTKTSDKSSDKKSNKKADKKANKKKKGFSLFNKKNDDSDEDETWSTRDWNPDVEASNEDDVWDGRNWVPREQVKKEEDENDEVWDGQNWVPREKVKKEDDDEIWDGQNWVPREQVEGDNENG